jgi:hypothetical protein
MAFNGSGPQQLGPAREQLRDKRLGRLPDLGNLHLKLALRGLHPARAEAVAQPGRRLRPPLMPGAAQPCVELLLDRALDDQPRAELRELRQRLARIPADPDRHQPVDCSSISADGGTVRLTRTTSLIVSSGLEEPTPCP